MHLQENVPLAPLTTLGLGGPARYCVVAEDEAVVAQALAFAAARGVPAFVLGAGSNLIVPDHGWDGVLVRIATRGLRFDDDGSVEVAAGEPWDAVVEAAVARGLGGLECLSGIPGTTGATPVQNVGAYGQEVSETIIRVRVLDRATGAIGELLPDACAFSYRDSLFKRAPERYVVLAVQFRLAIAAAPAVRYAELKAAVGAQPSLADVRATVLALRRRKSMVIDAADPNRRSVGSFFTNPVLTDADADAVAARAAELGVVAAPAEVPRFVAGPGQAKIPAAWLIERAGFRKGERRGPVGLSSAHALALVHHGGGSTSALLAFAREIRATVEDRFGVRLVPEPVVLGAAPGGDPLA